MKSTRNVNLKLFQTFVRVAERGSFRLAADETNRSQSAVSTQIRNLEDQLGIALFHRTTRRVQLTADGERLLASTKRALQEIEHCLEGLQEMSDIRQGRVSLSCSPTIAANRLAHTLAVFERDYPGVHVFVRELNPKELFESVRNREVDFAIGPVIRASDLNFETILNDDLYALVPRHLVKTSGDTITLAALSQMPLLLLHPASALRSLFESAMKKRGLSITTKYEFTQAQTLVSMASAGLGAAILPKIAVPKRDRRLCRVMRIVEPQLFRRVAIITVKGQNFSPAAGRLVQLLRQFVSKGE
jgi:DNA-binding transcriptional LysR family regulator